MRRAALPLLVIAGAALAAPLPFPKPAASPIVPGVCYRLEWCPGCAPFVAVFHPGGDYDCFREGETWPSYGGRWHAEGGTLHVEECDPSADSSRWRWTWHPRRGATLGGNDARIRAPPLTDPAPSPAAGPPSSRGRRLLFPHQSGR